MKMLQVVPLTGSNRYWSFPRGILSTDIHFFECRINAFKLPVPLRFAKKIVTSACQEELDGDLWKNFLDGHKIGTGKKLKYIRAWETRPFFYPLFLSAIDTGTA